MTTNTTDRPLLATLAKHFDELHTSTLVLATNARGCDADAADFTELSAVASTWRAAAEWVWTLCGGRPDGTRLPELSIRVNVKDLSKILEAIESVSTPVDGDRFQIKSRGNGAVLKMTVDVPLGFDRQPTMREVRELHIFLAHAAGKRLAEIVDDRPTDEQPTFETALVGRLRDVIATSMFDVLHGELGEIDRAATDAASAVLRALADTTAETPTGVELHKMLSHGCGYTHFAEMDRCAALIRQRVGGLLAARDSKIADLREKFAASETHRAQLCALLERLGERPEAAQVTTLADATEPTNV